MTDLLTGPLARGPRGYPGLYPYAEWTARAYPRHSVVAHLNCIWHANTTTTQEPAFGFDGVVSSADWDLWLDARGANEASDAATAAEAARGQAEDAAAEAVVTLGTVRTIERRIRAQDLGDFGSDADALAWAASQMPPISVVVGSSYWNTTSSIKRICSSTSSVPFVFVDEDADAKTQRTNAATAAVAAAAAQDAAETAASGAAASAATATSKATIATNQASAASTSAANAATSETNAAAGAATATTKASQAELSQTAAATSEANAAASAAGAASAAASAAQITGASSLIASVRSISTATDVVGMCAISTNHDRGGEGDWTAKCAGASWQTWGPFPKFAAALMRYPGNALSIVSRSDAAGPTWATWTISGGANGAVDYRNAALRYGGGGALYTIDFARDRVTKRDSSGMWLANQKVSAYDQSSVAWTQLDTNGVANSTINDIATCVLPATPLDPLRAGLAAVTTAAACNAGVNLIRADGVVVRSASTTATLACCFDRPADPRAMPNLWSLTATALNVTSQYLAASWDVAGRATFSSAQLAIGTLAKVRALGPNLVAVIGSTGVARVMLDPVNPAASLIAIKTPAWDTGWIAGAQGAIKFASAASVTSTTLAAPPTIIDDRSPAAANNATVVGTLTWGAISTGSDLAALNGFSTSNYVTMAYAAAFDPGSADLYVKCEVALSSAASSVQTFIDRAPTSGSTAYYRLDTDSSGKPRFSISDGTNSASVTAPNALPAGVHRLGGIRRTAASRIEIELDGVIVATASASSVGSLSNASAVLRFGLSAAGANPCAGALAQMQVGLVAPSADQCAAMWAGVHPMFASGAAGILTSSSIQALACDPDTDQYAVGNSSTGVDVFRAGLRVANWDSNAGVNRIGLSGRLESATATGLSSVVKMGGAGPAWGGGVAWALTEDSSTGQHRIDFGSIALTATSWVYAIPVKGGSREAINLANSSGAFSASWSTAGALLSMTGCLALASVDLGNGWRLVQLTFTGSGSAVAGWYARCAQADGSTNYAGDNGAGTATSTGVVTGPALYVGKPIIRAGSAALTAADYVEALSMSSNAKAIVLAGGDLVVETANGVDYFLPAQAGFRDTAKSMGVAKRGVYDPADAIAYGVTTDATPTVFAAYPIPEGRAYQFTARVTAALHGGVATERAVYVVEGIVSRDLGGNVAVTATTTTVSEVTSSMDLVAQANTTAQTLEIKATGKAASRIAWVSHLRMVSVGLMASA